MRFRPTEVAEEQLRRELIEVAAVALAWIEQIDAKRVTWIT
jgi:hypothetical protein